MRVDNILIDKQYYSENRQEPKGFDSIHAIQSYKVPPNSWKKEQQIRIKRWFDRAFQMLQLPRFLEPYQLLTCAHHVAKD